MFEDQPEASVEYLMTIRSLKQTLLDSINSAVSGDGVLPCLEPTSANTDLLQHQTRTRLLQMAEAEERRVLTELQAQARGA